MKVGDKVVSPAGHPATVTAIRDDGLVWVRFDDPGRAQGGFPVWKLTPKD